MRGGDGEGNGLNAAELAQGRGRDGGAVVELQVVRGTIAVAHALNLNKHEEAEKLNSRKKTSFVGATSRGHELP